MDLDKYIELVEQLTIAGEKHLEKHKEFDNCKDNFEVSEFKKMIESAGSKYIKLKELEDRYNKVEGELMMW